MNWFHLSGLFCTHCEPKPYNAFDSIDTIVRDSLQGEPLEAYFWEQSDVPSQWNLYWTDAAAYGGCLELDDSVFGASWTKYWGAHTCYNCDLEQTCVCEKHNCLGTHSPEGHAPAAAETANLAPVPLSVIELPTPTPSKIDVYTWEW